jgi:hypothetical protein
MRRRMVWSAPYWPALWRPRAAQEEVATKTPPPRPVKAKAKQPARTKQGRGKYLPTPEEIEAAKMALRPRHPSERLKPS